MTRVTTFPQLRRVPASPCCPNVVRVDGRPEWRALSRRRGHQDQLPLAGNSAATAHAAGDGKGSAAGREAGSLLPALSRSTRRFRSIAEDDSETRRQLVGVGRRDHSGSARRTFSEKEKHRADSRRPNRRRGWTAGLCHGIGGGPTAFLRFHLQETPPIPQSSIPLNPAKFTHKFRRRGNKM